MIFSNKSLLFSLLDTSILEKNSVCLNLMSSLKLNNKINPKKTANIDFFLLIKNLSFGMNVSKIEKTINL